jgi:hypothetical protein
MILNFLRAVLSQIVKHSHVLFLQKLNASKHYIFGYGNASYGGGMNLIKFTVWHVKQC